MSAIIELPSRVVFMGTPDFAVPSLRALIETPNHDVVGVVTQPDRPAGRGQQVRMSPVKEVALAARLPVIQPASLRKEPDAVEQLRAWKPDFIVVVAFGQILRQEVLDIPRVYPINVHASLLPRWRGAAPIQAAIRHGDRHTGVTTMVMNAGLDTGPILLQDSLPLAPQETSGTLHDKLAHMGAVLLMHTLDWLAAGKLTPEPQPEDPALITHAPTLAKDEGRIDWAQSAEAIDRHVRAFTPWPGTYTTWQGKRIKVLSGAPLDSAALDALPGTVLAADAVLPEESLDGVGPVVIATGAGAYVPTRLQLEGRQAMEPDVFLRGAPEFVGSVLGTE